MRAGLWQAGGRARPAPLQSTHFRYPIHSPAHPRPVASLPQAAPAGQLADVAEALIPSVAELCNTDRPPVQVAAPAAAAGVFVQLSAGGAGAFARLAPLATALSTAMAQPNPDVKFAVVAACKTIAKAWAAAAGPVLMPDPVFSLVRGARGSASARGRASHAVAAGSAAADVASRWGEDSCSPRRCH